MKRRSFLKLLGVGVAAAAVEPASLLRTPASGGPVGPAVPCMVGETGPESLLAGYDVLPPARFIYPVLAPMQNKLSRAAR